MKVVNTIVKVLTALAAIAGVVYVIATYGDKIVAWAKKLLASCPCSCKCEEACECEAEAECCCGETEAECCCEAEEACACEAEEVCKCCCEAAEEAPAEETAPVADEADFEG